MNNERRRKIRKIIKTLRVLMAEEESYFVKLTEKVFMSKKGNDSEFAINQIDEAIHMLTTAIED